MESTFATLANLGNCPGCPPALVQHPLAHSGSVVCLLQALSLIFKMAGRAFPS